MLKSTYRRPMLITSNLFAAADALGTGISDRAMLESYDDFTPEQIQICELLYHQRLTTADAADELGVTTGVLDTLLVPIRFRILANLQVAIVDDPTFRRLNDEDNENARIADEAKQAHWLVINLSPQNLAANTGLPETDAVCAAVTLWIEDLHLGTSRAKKTVHDTLNMLRDIADNPSSHAESSSAYRLVKLAHAVLAERDSITS